MSRPREQEGAEEAFLAPTLPLFSTLLSSCFLEHHPQSDLIEHLVNGVAEAEVYQTWSKNDISIIGIEEVSYWACLNHY